MPWHTCSTATIRAFSPGYPDRPRSRPSLGEWLGDGPQRHLRLLGRRLRAGHGRAGGDRVAAAADGDARRHRGRADERRLARQPTAFAAARAALGQGGGLRSPTRPTPRSPATCWLMGFAPERCACCPATTGCACPWPGSRRRSPPIAPPGGSRCWWWPRPGTTSTGAVDPLPELAELCRAEGLWFHVDGAYGAPGRPVRAGRAVLAGMERADSLVLDPHKWLFQPYEIGCVLVRRPGALERAFSHEPRIPARTSGCGRRGRFPQPQPRADPPLARAQAVADVPGLRRSTGCARRSARGIELAEHAEALLRARPGIWEVVTPAQLGIVTFALRGGDAGCTPRAPRRWRIAATPRSTTTKLQGRSVLRLCTINPTTTEGAIRE